MKRLMIALLLIGQLTAAHALDFFNDGASDVLLRDTQSRLWQLFDTDDLDVAPPILLNFYKSDRWTLQTIADFDGDGDADGLMRHDTGLWRVFIVNNGAVVDVQPLQIFKSLAWEFRGAFDADGDGDDDILLRNPERGFWWIFIVEDGAVVTNRISRLFRSDNWTYRGNGDFDGDGDEDVLLRHDTLGFYRLFRFQNGDVASNALPSGITNALDWQYLGSGDFDRDGTDDVLSRHRTKGIWRIHRFVSGNSPQNVFPSITSAARWTFQLIGDFDADGDQDIAIRDTQAGTWRFFEMEALAVERFVFPALYKNPRFALFNAVPAANEDPNTQVAVKSFLNGAVELSFAPQGSGTAASETLNFSNAALTAAKVFNGASYVLDNTMGQREREATTRLAPGTYTVSVSQSLLPAEIGTEVQCYLPAGDQVVISSAGTLTSDPIEVVCGTPIANPPGGYPPGGLFSACLARAHTVALFEEVLELNAVRNSDGAGLSINCNGFTRDPGSDVSVINEPFWTYLMRLDVVGTLDMSGICSSGCTSIDGAFGDPEILSLLEPYQGLFASDPNAFGPLQNTPTTRLTLLDFSYNFFSTPAWNDLYRISSSPFYSVGDSMTTNNSNLFDYFHFGLQVNVTPEAAAALADFGPELEYTDEVGDTFIFPLQDGAIVHPPLLANELDLGTLDDPTLTVFGLPPFAAFCVASGFNLTDGVTNRFAPGGNPPNRPEGPLTIDCDVPTDNGRVFADLNIPASGDTITLQILNGSGSVVRELTISPYNLQQAYFAYAEGLPNGSYTMEASTFNTRYACGGFTISGGGNVSPTANCSVSERASTFEVRVTSFGNGDADFTLAGAGTRSWNFFDAPVSSEDIFNTNGTFILNDTSFRRTRSETFTLFPGTYSASFTPDLQPAAPGLTIECDYAGGNIVMGSSDQTLNIFCGTPTRQLTSSELSALPEANPLNFPTVLQDAELFSVCLGNGGSDRMFAAEGVTSQIGSGVDYVEQIFDLNALQTSAGEGIALNCAGMGDVPGDSSAIDEALWAYLVRLDILSRLDLAGGLSQPTNGSYGNAEVLSLLSPYQALIDGAPFPFGVLAETPTQRLQLLDFSYNTFNNAEWTDLWRISSSPLYTVGDTRSLNNFGIIYSFGLLVEVSDAARDALAAAPGMPRLRIDPQTLDEGLTTELEFPLADGDVAMTFGPFDLGNLGEDPMHVIVEDLPGNVQCTATGLTLENGVANLIDGLQFRPYEGQSPFTVSCDVRPPSGRLAATFSFPEVTGINFNGSVDVVLSNGGTTIRRSTVLSGELDDFLLVINNLANGSYTLSVTVTSRTGFIYDCEGSSGTPVNISGRGNVELGEVRCSETSSANSIGDGLIAQCYRRAGINLLHELEDLPAGGTLDCSDLDGANDFELLTRPNASRTLDLRNSGLSTNDLRLLADVNLDDSNLSRVRLNLNPGVTGLTNDDFLDLLRRFDQIGTGDRVFPLGDGLVAQCLRRVNLASPVDTLVFRRGDELDCSGLRGANDFELLDGYIDRTLFDQSSWNFIDTGLNTAYLDSLSAALVFIRQVPQLLLDRNPNVERLGNLDYIPLANHFDRIDFGPGTLFPNLTYLKASDNQRGALFGHGVELDADGDTLLVSATFWSSDAHSRLGKAYLFERNGLGSWRETQSFLPALNQRAEEARYGLEMALSADGNTLALTRNVKNAQPATVDIWSRNGAGVWSIQASFTGSERFGDRLLFHNIGGDEYLVVGDPSAVSSLGLPTGEVRVFRRFSGQTTWRFVRAYAPAPGAGNSGDLFGSSFAVQSNGLLLIGAPGEDSENSSSNPATFGTPPNNNADQNSGAVYIFPPLDAPSGSGSVFKDLTSSPLNASKELGLRLGTADGRAFIGGRNTTLIHRSVNGFTQPSAGTVRSEEFDVGRETYVRPRFVAGGIYILQSEQGDNGLNVELIEPREFSAFRSFIDYSNVLTDERRNDSFAQSMAISGDGDTVAFGAEREDSAATGVDGDQDDNSSGNSGAVYVYP